MLDSTRPAWLDWSGSKAGKIIEFIGRYCIVPKGHGAGQPLQLAKFQTDAIEAFCADGVRTGEYSLGRGNGKSSLIAAFGLAHLCLDEWSPQVPLIATKLQQIEAATYSVAVAMAKRSPEITDRCLIYNAVGNKRIHTPYNDGALFPMASDVDGLQGLDPSLALVDEVGFVSGESWQALRLAGGKRPESLVLGLGTTGRRESALFHMHQLHRAGSTTAGHVRINYSATDGCDIRDRGEWHHANPGLAAGILSIDALEGDVVEVPESAFRAFRLNQWVDLTVNESWLGPRAIEVVNELADREYRWDPARPCFAGVDVSLKHDTTAVIAVQQRPDGLWHARGRVFRADHGVVDQALVQQYVRTLPNLAVFGYDPRFWELAAQQLAEEGITAVEIPQTPQRMVPAIGLAYKMITARQLRHDGDPEIVAQWANAVPKHSESGFTLSKLRSDLKIDAAVALALALSLTGTEPERDLTLDMLKVG